MKRILSLVSAVGLAVGVAGAAVAQTNVQQGLAKNHAEQQQIQAQMQELQANQKALAASQDQAAAKPKMAENETRMKQLQDLFTQKQNEEKAMQEELAKGKKPAY